MSITQNSSNKNAIGVAKSITVEIVDVEIDGQFETKTQCKK